MAPGCSAIDSPARRWAALHDYFLDNAIHCETVAI